MNNYMKIAKELSEENLKTNAGGPFGACIVKNGKIIGKGSNHVLSNNDPTAHAEIVAIREACKNINSYDLSGCELYASCYPCPMCLSAIIWSNIKKVYWRLLRAGVRIAAGLLADVYCFCVDERFISDLRKKIKPYIKM